MQRELTNPILEAFAEYAAPNLPANAPDDTDVPLLVRFKLGDLRSLKRKRDHMENVTKPALAGDPRANDPRDLDM
jgi:hypothetical protein